MTDDDTRVQEIIALLAIAGWTKNEPKNFSKQEVIGFRQGERIFYVFKHSDHRVPSPFSTMGGADIEWPISTPYFKTVVETLECALQHIIQGDA